MKIKNQQDFYSGLMFLVLGLLFAYGATDYAMGESARPGPGYFPMILSIIMAILGGVVIFKSLTIETEGGAPIGAIAWRPLIITTFAIVVFGLSLDRLGLIATVPLLTIIVSLAGREFSLLGVLATCVILTVFAWLVFIVGLNLNIPLWPAFMQ